MPASTAMVAQAGVALVVVESYAELHCPKILNPTIQIW